jgi:hypothetical protein
MSQTTVEEILQRIQKLPQKDRLLLEKRLAESLEGEWQKAANGARREAQRRKLDQSAIDQAVRDVRRPR